MREFLCHFASEIDRCGFRVYLDRSDASNKCHDVAEHVISVEKQSQGVRYVTSDDLDQEEGRGKEQH